MSERFAGLPELANISGSYKSNDGSTAFSWAMPEYSRAERAACAIGFHLASRKVVVTGWSNYFSEVRRAYCACGRKCWLWFEDGWADKYDEGPGGHLSWIMATTHWNV